MHSIGVGTTLVYSILCFVGTVCAQSTDFEGPLFDGHIHYNADVWEAIDPAQTIARLDAGGIERAFVSSTPTEGTERLYELSSERVIPLLRPYRSPADRAAWFADPRVLVYLRERLAAFPYRGIGEFHVFGADASTSQMDELIEFARERRLFLHAHSDTDAIMRILDRAPDIPVIWAHAGFDDSPDALAELLDRYPQLYLELSFRHDIAPFGQLSEAWRTLFLARPKRFLLGMDTYAPSRWAELGGLAQEARVWLGQLPPKVAQRIAYENAQSVVGSLQSTQPAPSE